MGNITEVALRRLDAIYFDEFDNSQVTVGQNCLLALLGYKLSDEALSSFQAATDRARNALTDALGALLPGSVFNQLKSKAENLELIKVEELSRDLANSPTLKELTLASKDDVQQLFKRLVEQKLPYSEQDLLDLQVLATQGFPVKGLKAAIRENNAVLAGLFEDYDWSSDMTITDGLRVAVVWSGGDATLATPTKFKLKRSQRRALANALERVLTTNDYAFYDFARHSEVWKRLFTALHVHDYKVPELQRVARLLFTEQLVTIDALLEYFIRSGELKPLLSTLSTMPGVFARRLQELLRKFPEEREVILESFTVVAPKVSTRVLVQMHNYFNGPSNQEVAATPFAGKSRNAVNGLLENRRSGDYSDVLASIDEGLSSKLQGVKVYVPESNDKIGVLTSNRSSALGSRAVASGSRIAIDKEAKFLSVFTHWKNMEDGGRVDLDISALIFNDSLTESQELAYYNTHVGSYANYSGDITDAPDGAEEYITLDVALAREQGYRYVALVAHSYTGQRISSIPECYAGVAIADRLEKPEFDAAAVQQRFDLATPSREVIPFMLDLKTLELVWIDMNFPGARHGANLDSSNSTFETVKYLLKHSMLTVEELLQKTAATVVATPEEADLVVDPLMSDQVAQLLN